jgi:hypothetical protein
MGMDKDSAGDVDSVGGSDSVGVVDGVCDDVDGGEYSP